MFAQSVQFFPSTEEIASEIYFTAEINERMTVLDPAAGNGALLDRVASNHSYGYHSHKPKTYAIELDQELRFILGGKGHQVIGSDFLEYTSPLKFDRIIMNPPFAHGAAMVLKAWEHLKDGGRLVSILNAETLNNTFSGDRKALSQLVLQYGSQKDLGKAFLQAARRTNVEVVMIVLKKPKQEQSWDFSGNFTHDEVQAEEFKANPLAHTDVIKNLVAKYKVCESILVQRHEVQSKLNFYLEGVSDRVYESDRDKRGEINLYSKEELTDQVMELKSRFWNTVFDKTELGKKATSGFREKFSDFSQQQKTMEFSEQNIVEMLSMFFLNREQIMEDCLIEVFDQAIGFHAKNCIHPEGWKTNKSYKLSKRIIHPYGVEFCKFFKSISVSWRKKVFLDDLDKVLCWLSGKSIDDADFLGTHVAIEVFCNSIYGKRESAKPIAELFFRNQTMYKAGSRLDYDQPFESTFFKIRVYKKGTMHLDFKDLYLLDDFNLAAAKGKKWIGAGY